MKLASPVTLVSCEYVGWKSCYELEYRASHGAATAGLLAKQFKVGTPLFVQGKHVVVREFSLTLTSGSIDEVTVRVEAVSFEAVLAGATGVAPPAKSGETKAAPSLLSRLGPTVRRILK